MGGRWTDHVLQDVKAERARQIEEEGFDADHDAAHDKGELAKAAAAYAVNAGVTLDLLGNGWTEEQCAQKSAQAGAPQFWPWAPKWWKPGSPRRTLIKAIALLVAQVEVIDRNAALGDQS